MMSLRARAGGEPMTMRVASTQAQTVSAERAAGFVESGMWLDYGAGLCQPDVFDKALGARIQEVTQRQDPPLPDDAAARRAGSRSRRPSRPRVQPALLRLRPEKHDDGRCNYIPVNLGEIPDYYRRFIDPVDIVILKTCPIDEDGYFNLSAANLWHRAIVERARMVIVETSRGLPYVHGVADGRARQRGRLRDRGRRRPGARAARIRQSGEIDCAVGRLIAAEIDDGDCLQIGIGGMPNAVCAILLESGVRDLGVHTEMMTDGLVDLYKAGRITGARKTLEPGQDRLHVRARLAALSTRRWTAIPTCTAARSTTRIRRTSSCRTTAWSRSTTRRRSTCRDRRPRNPTATAIMSGTGGQLQFVRGAYASKGGKSFICLASTYDKRGERRSRIVLEPDARQHRDHAPLRRHVRRHRVRHRQPQGEVRRRARQGAHRHRAPGLSRGPRAPGVRAPPDPARLCLLRARI